MIYIGRALRSALGTIEPALINPDLPVARSHPVTAGHDLAPRPSYHLMSAVDRAGYLAWLAGGRRDGQAPIGFVWLFLFGLERRVLLDATGADDQRELPVIAGEVRRLRELYGAGSPAFHTSATELLDALDLLTAPRGWTSSQLNRAAPPAPRSERVSVPMALRLGLAGFAVAGVPVPADWARSWAWFHPALTPRTPQTRCAPEFDRLFALRYTQRFTPGLVPRSTGAVLETWYQPASPGLTGVQLRRADLPDVVREPAATRELGVLVDSVPGALDPYSRWLAKTTNGRGSLAATALLPAELLDRHTGPLGRLLSWTDAQLDGRSEAVIDAAGFAAFWSTGNPERMARDEAAALALVLSRVGLGVEPDVRFGGPTWAPGPAVLFRLDDDALDHPRPGFLAATTMLHLAASVLSTIGPAEPPDDVVVEATAAELAATVRLSAAEQARIRARLRWLLAARVPTTGLARRAAALGHPEREAAGHLLIAVAAAAGPVSPAAVTALTGAYRMLGLDVEQVIHRLHQWSIAGASSVRRSLPAEEPVVIRRAALAEPGHALPWAAPSAGPAHAGPTGVLLSQETITRTMAETEAVSTLLAEIFVEDEPAPRPTGDTQPPGHLDRAHSDLLRDLAIRPSWARSDFVALARRHGLLPDGALDLLNDVAMDTAGEPVCEGEENLTVNSHILQELLR
jgi:hypothetical protein